MAEYISFDPFETPKPQEEEARLIRELASFALRNPLEAVMGFNSATMRQFMNVRGHLARHPSEMTQPKPGAAELFHKIVENRWDRRESGPENFRDVTISKPRH